MILLAATVRDGLSLLRHGPDGDKNQVRIVTPRNTASVRGVFASHIYATRAFDALPESTKRRVVAIAYPAIATSQCERCHSKWADLASPESQGSES